MGISGMSKTILSALSSGAVWGPSWRRLLDPLHLRPREPAFQLRHHASLKGRTRSQSLWLPTRETAKQSSALGEGPPTPGPSLAHVSANRLCWSKENRRRQTQTEQAHAPTQNMEGVLDRCAYIDPETRAVLRTILRRQTMDGVAANQAWQCRRLAVWRAETGRLLQGRLL